MLHSAKARDRECGKVWELDGSVLGLVFLSAWRDAQVRELTQDKSIISMR